MKRILLWVFLFILAAPAWPLDIPRALQENAVWEVFTNRQAIQAVLASSDGETLWMGTEGGLERRDLYSGDLQRIFTNLDGLPDNSIKALVEDDGGLWVGTEGGGLAYYNDAAWDIYSKKNSPLPNDFVNCLQRGADGKLWVGTGDPWGHGGLAVLDNNGNWQVFTRANSSLPDNVVRALAVTADGGVWIGTVSGLAYLGANGTWRTYSPDNSGLPDAAVNALQVEHDGSLWVGTLAGGLARLDTDGEWVVYHFDNSDMPDNWVQSLALDNAGNLWIGTSWDGGLAMRSPDDEWSAFEMATAPLPADFILSLASDHDGGIFVGTEKGLVQRDEEGEWHAVDDGAVPLPHNTLYALLADGAGGVWIGPEWGGRLTRLDADGNWEQAPFYAGAVHDLATDGEGGLWAANNGGLVRLDEDGEWILYDMENSPLPDNYIWSVAADRNGGLWVGAGLSNGDGGAWNGDNSNGGGLAYLDAQGQWTVYQKETSPLPGNQVRALATDHDGGVWVGLYPHEASGNAGGLAYRDAAGDWQVYTPDNSSLPGDAVRVLLTDDQGGIWVGLADAGLSGDPNTAEAGLLYRSAQGQWTLYNTGNTDGDLPDNRIETLLSDGEGGIWIGARGAVSGGGLIHRSAAGEWSELYVGNSGLPADWVTALQPDGSGGLWIATGWSGLAHLSFGEKTELAEIIDDPLQQNELLHGERAAIILHARGQSSGYNQTQALEFMAAYAYHSLYARGYDNDEIYFLSYRPDMDFNADAWADTQVVDGPVTFAAFRDGTMPRDLSVNDVEQAFAWAAGRGSLDQPLLVIFTGHGVPDGLLLDPQGREMLDSTTLHALLAAYRDTTGNSAVVIVEACHSGSLVSGLSAPQRTVITSTGDGLAYYGDLGRTSFIRLYFDSLRDGDSFTQAVQAVRQNLQTRGWPFNRQQPQLADSVGGIRCLNGCWGSLPGELTLTVETPGGTVPPGTSVELQVQAQVAAASVRKVWASVVTPRIAAQRNEQGYSRLPEPVINLRAGTDGTWSGRFDAFTEQGDYLFAIKARDHEGFVTEAAPVNFSVAGGSALAPALFDAAGGILDLPAVTVAAAGDDLGLFRVQMRMLDPNTSTLVLLPETLAPTTQNDTTAFSNFSFDSGMLHVPLLAISGAGDARYGVDLKMTAPDYRFQVDLASFAVR